MIETIIVREPTGFRTYAGWVLNRTDEVVVLAAISDVSHEPCAVVIPVDRIVTDVATAA